MFNTSIRGKKYIVASRKKMHSAADGFCDPPTHAKKQILVREPLSSPTRLLEILIHEALHAAYWDLDEKAIEHTARDIAKMLVKAGVDVDPAKIYDRLRP